MMKIERSKNATRNVIYGLLLKTYQMIIPFIIRTLIIYTLGVNYLGLNSLFTSILQVLNLAELGVGSAMVFSMYDPIAKEDKVTICALMKLYKIYYRVIGLIVLIGGICIVPLLPKLITGEIPTNVNLYFIYFINLSATVLSYWMFAYKNSILQAHQRVDMINKVMLFTETIKYFLQFIALIMFKNYYLFIMIILFSQVLTNVITALISNKMYPQYHPKGDLSKSKIKQINNKIRDLFTAKLGGTIVSSTDTIVISAFLGLTDLAIYQNYYYIMNTVMGFLIIVMNACTAGIGNSIVIDSIEKNYQDFKKFIFTMSWIASVCVCCFVILYQPVMIMWVSDKYLLPYTCVIMFPMYFYMHIIQMCFCTYKDAAGIWHEDRLRPLLSGILNLLLNVILVNKIGMYAILLSTILSYLLIAMPWVIYNLFNVYFKRSPFEIIQQITYYILHCVLNVFICIILCNFITVKGVVEIIFKLIICFFFSNIYFFIIFKNKDEFKYLLFFIKKFSNSKYQNFKK